MSEEEYLEFFKTMFHMSRDKIKEVDAVVVLNYDKVKNGKSVRYLVGEDVENYIKEHKLY